MNKIIKLIIVIIILITSVITGFYLWFAAGMKHANSVQPINTSDSLEYETDIKKEFSNILAVNIYYKQGRIHFDFAANSEMSLEECKQVVRKTIKGMAPDVSLKSMLNSHSGQETIIIEFNNTDNIYISECPYYIQTVDPADNPNNTDRNYYKIWYLTVNNKPSIQIEF